MSEPEILTAPEVAALLRIDVKTVYAMAAASAIPGVRRFGVRGGSVRFHRPTLVAWLEAEERGSQSRRKR